MSPEYWMMNVTELPLNMTMAAVAPSRSTPQYTYCPFHQFIINGLIAGLVCLLGMLGNTISFIVLSKDRDTPVASFLLQSLAFFDNFFLFVWFFLYSIRDILKYAGFKEHLAPWWMYILLYSHDFMFVAQTGTIWMTVLIAVSRFLAVCVPYKAVHLCTLAVMRKAVVGIGIFSILYNLSRFFEFQVQARVIPTRRGNITVYQHVRTALGGNEVYGYVYSTIMYIIFSFVLPLLLLAILNTKLALAYRQILNRRRRMTSNRIFRSEQDPNITLVMIIVILIFMICQAPARLYQLIWSYTFTSCNSVRFYLFQISNVLEVLNSSTNFVIYCAFRHQFRQGLGQHVCGYTVINQRARANSEVTNNHTTALDTQYTVTATTKLHEEEEVDVENNCETKC